MQEKRAEDMTDDAIAAEIEELGAKWDDLRRDLEDSGGHGGSPGEWMVERMDELETEQRRRTELATYCPAADRHGD